MFHTHPTPPLLNHKQICKFWSKVDCFRDGCWPWNGRLLPNGYGVYHPHKGRTVLTHRVAHFLNSGEWPMRVLHSRQCTIKHCCRPSHLRAGTQAENIADLIAVGRFGCWTKPERVARGDRNGSRRHPEKRPRGSRHANSVLTEEDVRTIRERFALGETCASIARSLGKRHGTILDIRNGRTWSWLK